MLRALGITGNNTARRATKRARAEESRFFPGVVVNNCCHWAICSVARIWHKLAEPFVKGQSAIFPRSSIGIEYSTQKPISKKALIPATIMILTFCKDIIVVYFKNRLDFKKAQGMENIPLTPFRRVRASADTFFGG